METAAVATDYSAYYRNFAGLYACECIDKIRELWRTGSHVFERRFTVTPPKKSDTEALKRAFIDCVSRALPGVSFGPPPEVYPRDMIIMHMSWDPAAAPPP